MSDEIRTGLGDLFVKKVIENNDYEYCNRSKAEAGAVLCRNVSIDFSLWMNDNCQNISSDECYFIRDQKWITIGDLFLMFEHEQWI